MTDTNYVECGNCKRTCLESDILCPYCNFRLVIVNTSNKDEFVYTSKKGGLSNPVNKLILFKSYPSSFSDILLGDFSLFINFFNVFFFLFFISIFWVFGLIIVGLLVLSPIDYLYKTTNDSIFNSNIIALIIFILILLIDLIISLYSIWSQGRGTIYLKNNPESLSFVDKRLQSTGMKLVTTEYTGNGKQIEVTNGIVKNITVNHKFLGGTLYKTHKRSFYGNYIKIRYFPGKIKLQGKLKDLRYFLPELKSILHRNN